MNESKRLKSELNNKVKNGYLEIGDLHKIWSFKNKVDNLDNNELKECIKEFEELINKYASPKTKDDAKRNVNYSESDFKLNPIINQCSHEEIIPCNDNPSFYRCNYCWEQDSSEFLKCLEEMHRNNIYNNWFKNYGLSSLDINEFILTKEFEIVRHSWYGNKTFFNQKQLKEAYDKLEKRFNNRRVKERQ